MKTGTRAGRTLILAMAALVIIPLSAGAYVAGGPRKTLDEILALPAKDFHFGVCQYTWDAIENNDVLRLPGLWTLLDKAVQDRRPEGYPSELGSVTEAIGLLGSEADLRRLRPYGDSEKNDYVRFNAFLIPRVNAFVRRELASILAGPAQNPLPVAEGLKPPEWLEDASPELLSAWMKDETIRKNFEPLVSSSTHPVNSFSPEGISDLDKTIGDFLDGKTGSITDQISGYYWASKCGTSSQSLYAPKYLGMFASLLKERRYQEALGALLAFENEDNHVPSTAATKAEMEWKRRFIAFCGYDWEALYVGAQLSHPSGGNQLSYLTAYGSDRFATLLADILELPELPSSMKRSCVSSAGQLVTPMPASSRMSRFAQLLGTRVIPAPRTEAPVSAPAQDRLLKLIIEQVTPDMDEDMARVCTYALERLNRPETRDALRIILGMPYDKYRKLAAHALNAMGETVTVPPPAEPVRFMLFDHGTPLRGMKVDVRLYYQGSESWGLMTWPTADADGIISLDHDLFADPKKQVAAVALQAVKKDLVKFSPEDPVLFVWQPTPDDLGALTKEALDFAKLTVIFKFANPSDLKWSLMLNLGVGPKSLSYMAAPALSKDIPTSGRIVFPKVARGPYRLEVKPTKSYKPLVSRDFEMTGRDQTIELSGE